MADEKKSKEDDALAREIDKLLGNLPKEPTVTVRKAPVAGGSAPSGAPAAPVRDASPTAQKLGVWSRVTLAVGLGAAVLWWPYGYACGVGLFAFLFALTAVLVSGLWASVWSWRRRLAGAHIVSLALLFWGTALMAREILPRIGYAEQAARWTCGS